jgi:hypothetical protein
MIKLAQFAALALPLFLSAATARAAVYTTFVAAAQNSSIAPTRIKLSLDDSFPNNAGQPKTWGNGVIDGTGNRGGEFRVTWYSSGNQTLSYTNAEGANWIYKTFCIERGETFSPSNPYYVTVDPVAYNGAYGGGSPDPLGSEAKLLYGLYFLGLLDNQVGLNFAYENNDWANALQAAFWNLEDLKPTVGDLEAGVPTSVLGKADDLVDWAKLVVNSGYNYFDNKVQVLNLWNDKHAHTVNGQTTYTYSGLRQSQMIYVGGTSDIPPPIMPEPASCVVWAVGLGIAGIAGRRRLLKAR